MMNIMHVILDLPLAGAQEVVRTLSEHLPAHGCKVVVCSFSDGPMRPHLEALGIPVELVNRPKYSVTNPLLFTRELIHIRRQLLEIVRRHQIEVVQTHILEMLDFLCLSLRGHHQVRAVYWSVHNVEMLPTQPGRLLPAKRIIYRRLYQRLGLSVDGFIAVSEEVRSAILETLGFHLAPRVITINNGVDVSRYQHHRPTEPLPGLANIMRPNRRFLLTIGRLTMQKGQTYLIQAMPQIIAAHPETHLLIVGEGELAAGLQQQAEQSGHADHIHFLGRRQDIPALLALAEIFVLPSLWEGLSIALLEAMAAAKPIVATAVSGTTQVMRSPQTGFVVPPHQITPLVEAINHMLSHPAEAIALGQVARHYIAEHYSVQKQAATHAALYQRGIV